VAKGSEEARAMRANGRKMARRKIRCPDVSMQPNRDHAHDLVSARAAACSASGRLSLPRLPAGEPE